MRIANEHTEYKLLDASGGERLEDWNGVVLIRPDPQVLWNTPKTDPRWKTAAARYVRSSTGGGAWEMRQKVPDVWQMRYKDLKFNLKPMGFKHTGVFPEQAVNWDLTRKIIAKADKPFPVLNLFAYTGGATLACLAEGAEVVHVDASKGMVAWGRENAEISGLANAKCRWIVDDCLKFVERETRRGSKYRGIIMDPPSYGRGPNGEVWQLESKIHEFVASCANLLADDAEFVMINSYTTGLAPSAVAYLLGVEIAKKRGGSVTAEEIGLPVESTGLILPCGGTAIWTAK